LGIDYETLHALNPRLIYTSITAYGRDLPMSGRPDYDLLVNARTGLNWEHRGWPETALCHMMGLPDPAGDLPMDYTVAQGPPRPGPIVTASPAPSLGAFYCALTAISAALYAREATGKGQWVETTLLQGALAAGLAAWQRAEKMDTENFNSWIFGSKAPKGHFETKDGRWIHNWVPNPRFIISASEGDTINSSPELSAQNDPDRFGMGPEESLVISYYQPILAERVKKFTADEWVEAAKIADVTLQEARSPELSLADPYFLSDGCVREIEDPELGPIRQVGVVIDLEKTPGKLGGPAPQSGQHNAEIRAEAARLAQQPAAPAGVVKGKPGAPLAGIKVLDLGLAIAGPFGTQLLSDLGADVIKINTLWDSYWHGMCVAFLANRGKRSLCVDLKKPEGIEILRKLVEEADVVQHNMRYEAAVRLGVDYESLKKIKPDLIYCHTRGHEKGPRETSPGNDQTGACIAGVQYEDGGMADGGKPLWSLTAFGDTGNGYLSAIGILQALYHRARTGEGQFVGTSIVNAQLLNCSFVLAKPDGTGFDRPRLDRMQLGMSALYGIYETAAGWIAIVASNEPEWQALCQALGKTGLDDPKFASAEGRKTHDRALRAVLEQIFQTRPAAEWLSLLDAAGAPCEIVDPEFGRRLFDDPDMQKRRWVVAYEQGLVGKFEQAGLSFDFSETPGVIQGAPLVVGDHTDEILTQLGYAKERIDGLKNAGVVASWAPGEPQIRGYKPATAQEPVKA